MKEFFEYLKFAWKYAKGEKKRITAYIIFNIISILISVFVPIVSAKIIVSLTEGQFKQVLLMSLVILVVELSRSTSNYFLRLFSQIIYRETFTKIQSDLGKEMLKLETKTIDENSSGIFIQRLTNDTSKIADIFNALNMYLGNIITDIGIFAAVFIINKLAFLYLVVMVIIIYFVEKKRVKIFNEKDKSFRKKNEYVSGFVGELVRGIRDIKMLNAEKSFMKELNDKVIDLNQERYAMSKTDRNYGYIRNTLIDFFDTGMIFLLVGLIVKTNLSIANAIVIHNYTNRVTSIVNYVSILMEKIKDFNLSSSRIFSIIKSPEFPKEKFGKKHLEKVKGNFEFNNVHFSYNEGKEVLSNLTFKVNEKETVAFVGKSGTGKSTIFNLLCKMYDISDGEIKIDGQNIKELDKESIRGNITIINQSPYIFNMSIRDNLRLVKEDLTEEEMIEACKLACLDEFISVLPDKYDTMVGEGGLTLSGGQRQRLAIARALVQKTEIILFDEATSALDNETQSKIQQAIQNLQKDYTILIVAHRLSTVVNSDRILFLNNGRIEAEGTHQELLKNCPDYKHLYEAEMSKEQ
ncbi:MAG: ABC transporter ATP-binding protein [Bacilli bacterium]|nr:ABC transporter ATP-binding protein [Bacilli bacterium]